MASDLDLELELRVVPTVRDEDGVAAQLAQRLPLDRTNARRPCAIPRALEAGAAAHARGRTPRHSRRAVLAAEPLLDPEYVEVAPFDGRVYLLAAVHVGRTRLIDNVVLEGDH